MICPKCKHEFRETAGRRPKPETSRENGRKAAAIRWACYTPDGLRQCLPTTRRDAEWVKKLIPGSCVRAVKP